MKKIFSILGFIFFIAAGYFLYKTVSELDWNEVRASFGKVSLLALIPPFLVVVLDYLLLSSYDFVGFRFFKVSSMRLPRTLISAFCCYAFNLNLGALVGGLGFRLRIYSGWGVDKATISKVILFSTVTNWLGHAFLLSGVFLLYTDQMVGLLKVSEWLPRSLGCLLLLLISCYFFLCFKQKVLHFKGHTFQFPNLNLAFFQIFLSVSQWASVSFVIYLLIRVLGNEVEFAGIVLTALVASVAGVITHIPGGLGVLETIFLKAELGVPVPDLVAALVLYRILFYITPLAIALPCYLGIEFHQKRNLREQAQS